MAVALRSLFKLSPAVILSHHHRIILPPRQVSQAWLLSSSSSSSSSSSPAAESVPAAGKKGLKLSDSCVARLNEIAAADSDSNTTTYLRILVEGGGCSGFTYNFDLDDKAIDEEEDRLFEREGAKVVIDETSLEYLHGSTVDYHKELIRAAFRIIDNPLQEEGCSCGASFSIKLD